MTVRAWTLVFKRLKLYSQSRNTSPYASPRGERTYYYYYYYYYYTTTTTAAATTTTTTTTTTRNSDF
jgi:hypothetical protein